MPQAPSDDFLRYYLEELSYVRQQGERFARAYPKVAGRLELQGDECPDPHVERLIESFAFLTARIQADLDADFPEIAAELLDVLYPHYLTPIPSMSVARFDFDPERGKLTSGFEIPRHTPLFAHSEQGALCRMRTAYPVTLWPIEVTEAELETPEQFEFIDNSRTGAVLRLRLESRSDPFEVLGVDRLRFFLSGEPVLVSRLYEMLFDNTRAVAVLPADPGARPSFLPEGAIAPVGFREDEDVIPYPRHSHPAYRLLQEYFSFADKFHFADVSGLAGRASGMAVDLLFLLDHAPSRKLLITPDAFALGCTPIINLFRKTSEPIRIDHRRIEYRLMGDMRKEKTTEIHSIVSVSSSMDEGGVRDYAPFYSFTHDLELRKQKAFWHARRVATQQEEMTGTEVLLSFRDLEFQPQHPPDEIVYAHLLCTNRALAVQLPAGALLQSDEAIPASRIVCVKKPTRPMNPPLGGQALWRLVSHLSLNYLSLGGGKESLKALHEILGLYCFSEQPSLRQQIMGIRAMEERRIVRRLGQTGWKGFCRGTEITLSLDDSVYVGSSGFLLGTVLNHFFALYASINSFSQLVIKRTTREGVWKRWPPMAGARPVL